MTTLELEGQKALLVRDILTEINDKNALEKLRRALERIMKSKNTDEVEAEETISKKELLAGADARWGEAKQTMTGQLKAKTARKFADEL